MTNENDEAIMSNHYFFIAVLKNGDNNILFRILNKRLDKLTKKGETDDLSYYQKSS